MSLGPKILMRMFGRPRGLLGRLGGRAALAFTTYSGQDRAGVPELIASGGFSDCRVAETDQAFCVLASAAPRP